MEDQRLVRLTRGIARSDKIDGFVVAIGKSWLLLAALDPNIYLNGFIALRLSDLSKVTRRRDNETFVRRALMARDQWPPSGPPVNLDSMGELIRSASANSGLITIHVEERDTTVCYIGHPVKVTERSVQLLEITPSAQWEDRPTKWAFTDITRVEFGGGYEDALAIVGGSPPA